VAPSFLRQVEVHIQQVLQRESNKQQAPAADGLMTDLLEAIASKWH
jgi:hypothetical protein